MEVLLFVTGLAGVEAYAMFAATGDVDREKSILLSSGQSGPFRVVKGTEIRAALSGAAQVTISVFVAPKERA